MRSPLSTALDTLVKDSDFRKYATTLATESGYSLREYPKELISSSSNNRGTWFMFDPLLNSVKLDETWAYGEKDKHNWVMLIEGKVEVYSNNKLFSKVFGHWNLPFSAVEHCENGNLTRVLQNPIFVPSGYEVQVEKLKTPFWLPSGNEHLDTGLFYITQSK